jgi:Tol biopolymer transport system component
MRTLPILLLAVGLTLAACGDPGSPSTDPVSTGGMLVVSTSTGGADPDPDGYLLTVDGVDSLVLTATGTAEIGLPAGHHTLLFLGLAAHCSVSPETPLDVAIPSGDTMSVAFEVTCSTTGARITTMTTGLDIDPDGYRIVVDGTDRGAITANDTVPIRLAPGSRIVGLTDLSPNCTIDGPGSRTVTIEATDVAPIEFVVVCAATSGVIGVVILGSGVGAVHQATVDSGPPFTVGPGDRSYLGGVPAGDHMVSLSPAGFCSVNTDMHPVTVTAGSLIRDTVEVTFPVTCVAVPARARIAFVRSPQPGPDGSPGPGTPDIYIANADGSGAARLTSGESPAWSPDGRRIAFYRGGMIHVIDADGSDERSLRQGGNPAWAPDGTRIVFNTGFNRDDGIFVINADGSGLRRLIRRDFANPGSADWTGWPEWSPDGRQISFVHAPDYDSYEPWQIYVMKADGSDPRNLNVLRSVGGSFAEVHSWSPDGSRIALGVNRGQYWTIASVDSSGADYRVHYREEPGGYAAHPDWSPDGRRIVFNRYVTTSGCKIPSCPMRVFVVSTEGGSARQLIPELDQGSDYWDHQPTWSHATD